MKTTLSTVLFLLLAFAVACDGGAGRRPPLSPADRDNALPACALDHTCGAP